MTPKKKENEERQGEIVLLAGGTGGHIFPAQILAEAFEERGIKTLFMTDQRGCVYLKKETSFKVHILEMTSGSFLKRLWGILKNVRRILKLFKQKKPKIVIGFGGYPSAPGALAAIFLKVPLCLHEQNSVLGRVNRLLLPFSKILFLTFPRTDKISVFLIQFLSIKKKVVGPLVRSEIEQVERKAPRFSQKRAASEKLQMLILGGSQGSLSLTEGILKGLGHIRPKIRANLFVTFQSPEIEKERVEEELHRLGISHEVASFFTNMERRLSKAHFMLARAGSSTVGESLATCLPTIFVPLPSAMDDHQTRNAAFIAFGEGGWMIPQNEMFSEKSAQLIEYLFENPKELQKASLNLSKMYRAGALEKILESVDVLVKERHKEIDFLV